MNVILLGPPGSGKGSQAKRLADKFGMLHISTGDLIRAEIASKSELGNKIRSIVDDGGYISDEIMLQILAKTLSNASSRSIIFDGFPRTMNQVLAFDGLLSVEKLKVDLVIDLKISDDLLLERISGRMVCVDCKAVYHEKHNQPKIPGVCDVCGSKKLEKRADDDVEVMKNRLKVYQEQTVPISSYYADAGLLKTVDAAQPLEKVGAEICSILNSSGLSL
jgi:adenylate kinase